MKTLFAGLLAVTLTACSSGYNSDGTPKMTALTPRLQQLFATTKPVCFGRFVIEVPASTIVAWGPTHINDELTSYPKDGNKIPRWTKERIDELQAEKHRRAPSMLLEVKPGPNTSSKIVAGYQSSTDKYFVRFDSFIQLAPHAFVQRVPSALTEDYEQVLKDLTEVAARLRVRADDEVPSEPGICLEAGFVADDSGRFHEMNSIGFRIPEFDAHLSIRTIKNRDRLPDWSLESLLKEARDAAIAEGKGEEYDRNRFLRRGERKLDGWQGQEALAAMSAAAHGVHQFHFLAPGEVNNSQRPELDIQLDTGVVDNQTAANTPKLSDEEAVALWDRITSTLRVRPAKAGRAAASAPAGKAAEAAPAEAPPKPPALGAKAASYSPCPQSGVWECAEQHTVGPRRRVFAQGQRLPPVEVIQPVQRGLGKWLGQSETVAKDTVWTLVAYQA